MDALKWLWSYLKNYRWSIIIFMILSVIFISTAFVNPLVIGHLVGEVQTGTANLKTLFFLGSMVLLATIIKETIVYIRAILYENVSQGIIKRIRQNLYQKLQSLDCHFFDTTKTGDLMSRFTMDADSVRVVLAGTIPTLVNQFGFIVIGLMIMFAVNWLLALGFLAIVPFIGLFAYLLATRDKPNHIAIRERNAELNTVVRENISGNRVVKAYSNEELEIEKFEECNENYRSAFMTHVHTWCKYYTPMHFFVLMTNIVFIFVGGLLVMNGKVTIGEYATIHGCLWCIVDPMATIGTIVNQYQSFVASTIKIRELEASEPQIKDCNVQKRDTGISGKIQFKNVTFSYDGERVLRHVNFTANPGDTVAIIGPTGSGKSTIINLLYRFYDPTKGAIYIDDINLKNIELATIRKNVASAMQDVFLFSDTIRNNIAFGIPNATEQDIIRVAKMADAHEFISKLPDGYDTMVGERGTGLSGGQRQRISLARALLKNPSILILDDTTSALDMETEFSIQENLKQTYKTKIIIAHRISSVKNADLILVLNHGALVEWGTHDTLLKLGGYYKGVFEHQFGDFNHSSHNDEHIEEKNGGDING